MKLFGIGIIVVLLVMLVLKQLVRNNWRRSLSISLDNLAKKTEQNESLVGYAADMSRLSVGIFGGDKTSKKKGKAILKLWPHLLREIQKTKETATNPASIANLESSPLMQKAAQLFDMDNVILQEQAFRKRKNHLGELSEPVGKHVAEMVGKSEQNVMYSDIERGLKCIDHSVIMPSQHLIDALGGIDVLKTLSFLQIHQLGDAELYIELAQKNRARNGQTISHPLTMDDLNNVAKEFLWLSNTKFFEALALRYDISEFSSSALDEFLLPDDQLSNEKASRQKLRAAVELGAGAEHHSSRERLLTEALTLSPRYEKQAQGIANIFRMDAVPKAMR